MINSPMEIHVDTLYWLSEKYSVFSAEEQDAYVKLTFAQISAIALEEAKSVEIYQSLVGIVGDNEH